MKKVLIPIALLAAGFAAWYLGSPLFINKTVDEPFPVVQKDPVVKKNRGMQKKMEKAEEEKVMEEDSKDSEEEKVEEAMEKLEGAMEEEAAEEEVVEEVDKAVEEEPAEEEQADAGSENEKMIAMFNDLTEEEAKKMAKNKKEAVKMLQDLSKIMPKAEVEDPMPKKKMGPELVLEGEFKGTDSFHTGSGKASIYKLEDGSHILRFENFEVTNGPALSVFLSKNDKGNKDKKSVNVGELKGNMGNQNYILPENIKPKDFKSVVIYCVPFKVKFAFAPLK